MIYVLECPPAGTPRAWFAYDAEDLVERVADRRGLKPWEVWDRRSARELLAMCGEQPDAPGVGERLPALCALGAEHGWDTALYRADALLGRGVLAAQEVRPLQACGAVLAADGTAVRIWPDETSAIHAFEHEAEPLWHGAGWRARHALRDQLIATEALADS
ncbi:hypothetical protein [Rubrivivax gelatinosus]|uniref:Uncharacterized protein n=1 Tax=Rubrivivax gelatinosus TaxID=28068 RepID=A0A4R2M6Y3_RUBGE|nr:hypothetical protein [Rubrivivax gelatinosus]MBK1687131.1 hypothetical protein [Rubrivivax gelatinosus]TCP00645.1 hypothetical protein EV684_11283 [Rubrivivax gelatinosus]